MRLKTTITQTTLQLKKMDKSSWIDKLLDLSVIFSFDKTGFKRHCQEPLKPFDLTGKTAIITGASSGIGLATAKTLLASGLKCDLLSRDLERLKINFGQDSKAKLFSIDLSDLSEVFAFTKDKVKEPIDLIIHNAGSMPESLTITNEGFETVFASQVLAPFIMTKTLIDQKLLKKGGKVIFVSSGGMYLQPLDLKDLKFEKHSYNKYLAYANAKRAQVILSELFARNFPDYIFSSMHPGWADTAGVQTSMPTFKKLLKNRLRTKEEGADTIIWLATTNNYPSGKFWFDRKAVKTTIFNFFKPTKEEETSLWVYCESVLNSIKEGSLS